MRQNQVKRQAHGQQYKRQRQHVRMQIPQQEAEEGKLVNHLLAGPREGFVVDDPRGAPPPPVVAWIPGVAGRRPGQVLHVQPAIESLSTDTFGVKKLKQPFKIAQHGHKQRAQKAEQ